MKKIILLSVLIAAGIWLFTNDYSPKSHVASWQDIADGVETKKFYLSEDGILNSQIEILVLRMTPEHLRIAVDEKKTAEQWRQSTDSIAAINGGFFDENDRSLGLRQSEGEEITSLRSVDWGVFFVKNGRAHIAHTKDFKEISTKGITEAIQCGPRLVVDGKITDLKNQQARRTGIGIDDEGNVLIAVCDYQLSLTDWANFWASPEGLNCKQALNLDGGGSTQLSLKSDNDSEQISGLWSVPDVLLVK